MPSATIRLVRGTYGLLLLLLLACDPRGEELADSGLEAAEPSAEVPRPAPVEFEGEPRFPSRFLGEDDGARRTSLAEAEIAQIEPGRGGRTLAFRITLEDGTRGYYKPEQSFSSAHWYSELAAHYLDRELGFERAPPAVGRRMRWAPLERVSRGDPRIPEVSVAEDGTVRGAFLWWIEGGLPTLDLGRGWARWLRFSPAPAFSPYQRPGAWRAIINGDIEPEETELFALDAVEDEPPTAERARELSDLVVFDFLISNVDRWSPDRTNLRTRGRDGPLVFLDNAAGFWPGRNRLGLMDARLSPVQRFRRETHRALERFDVARFRSRLQSDPLSPILDEFQIAGVAERRRALLEHIATQRARFGDAIYLP